MPVTTGLIVAPGGSATTGAVIELTGPLVVRTAVVARDALAALLDERRGEVVIDLRGVTELDTAGLAAVTARAMSARRAGVDVTVLAPVEEGPRRLADRVGVLGLIGGR